MIKQSVDEIMLKITENLLEYKRYNLTLENNMLEAEKLLIDLQKIISSNIAFRLQVDSKYLESIEKMYSTFFFLFADINKLQLDISKLAATVEI